MNKLPPEFKSVLWSYDFDKCDPMIMKKTIILQTLKYGTLFHWKWIRNFYGDDIIREILSKIRGTEISGKSREFISVVFNFNNWNYAQRGA